MNGFDIVDIRGIRFLVKGPTVTRIDGAFTCHGVAQYVHTVLQARKDRERVSKIFARLGR